MDYIVLLCMRSLPPPQKKESCDAVPLKNRIKNLVVLSLRKGGKVEPTEYVLKGNDCIGGKVEPTEYVLKVCSSIPYIGYILFEGAPLL